MPIIGNIAGLAQLDEAQVLEQGVEVLRGLLPEVWDVQRAQAQPGESDSGSAIVNISVRGQAPGRVVFEARPSFAPREVDRVVGRRRLVHGFQGDVPFVVVAPWISERARQVLVDAELNYLDLTGNVRIASTYPPLYIERTSFATGPRLPQYEPRLKGPKAARIVRLLVDVCPPYGVLDLARAAGVTPGYVSRLLEMLDREALVQRTARGGVASVDWQALIRRQAQTYSLFDTNRVQRYVCPTGPAAALDVAGELASGELYLTGSFAARRIAPIATGTLLVLYATGDPRPLVERANLLSTESGANVVVATPYDPGVTVRLLSLPGLEQQRVPMVACSQIALDCLTGSGRMPQEGEALLEWMAVDESTWRLPNLAAVTAEAHT